MYASDDELALALVLKHYPQLHQFGRPIALGNRGGFSGARLWRLAAPDGDCCLRAWPRNDLSTERLGQIHQLMQRARQRGLAFVPAVMTSVTGMRCVQEAGRLWELTTWQTGRADFHERPTPRRLEAACMALARIHEVWAEGPANPGPCPAVLRRLERYREWQHLFHSGWRPTWDQAPDAALRHWSVKAWSILHEQLDRVPALLSPWVNRNVPLQPCLCDVWHDHLLFEGDELTGLVDYGAVKRDHVAVDLARMLGSLVEDNGPLRAIGLKAYRCVRPLSPDEELLVDVLDRTGALLALATWLRWLYHERRPIESAAASTVRLARLVQRVQAWQTNEPISLWTQAGGALRSKPREASPD